MYLDDEMNEQHRQRIAQHLHECPPCLAAYRLYQSIKALVASRGGEERAPDGLKNRLRQSIRSIVLESTEVTVELGAPKETRYRVAAGQNFAPPGPDPGVGDEPPWKKARTVETEE